MKRWLATILLIIPLGLLVYSTIRAENKFAYFEIPFQWVISFIIAIFVTYGQAQKNIDKRRKSDSVALLLERSISMLSDEKLYNFDATEANGDYLFGYAKKERIYQHFRKIEKYLQQKKQTSLLQIFEKAEGHFNAWGNVFDEVMHDEELRKKHEKDMRVELFHCAEELVIVRVDIATVH